MLSIAEIREQYPDTKDLSDSEILFRVSKLTDLPIEQVAQDFGIRDPRKAPKGALGGINDFMINTANAAVGGIKAGVDMFAPGSSVSKGLGEFIESGEQKLSLQERLSQQRLAQGLESSEFGPQAGAVLERIKEAPLQTAAQAIGSFAIPGTAIKGARGVAGALGAGEKALARVGTGTAMGTGALLSGGDAAGEAFDRVLAATGDRDLATQAAREASIAPALVGAATSLFGADKALARGGSRSILRTAGGEFAGEFAEEAATKASANYATSRYVPDTDVFAGVFGSGLMGGIQGAGTGAAVGMMTKQRTMLSGTNEVGGPGGLQSDGSGIGKAINVNEADVNTRTALPIGPIQVNARGEALVTPEQQQAYDQFGRNQAAPAAPTPVQQSGQVAAANLQAQQQEAQAVQAQAAQQQQQQAQQQFGELSSVYGLSGGQPGTPFSLGGKNLFTQNDAEVFLRAVDKLNEGKTLEQKQAFGSVVSSGAVKIKPDATPKAVVNTVNTFMDKWGLGSSENTTDLAERVNANISRVEGSNALNVAGPLNDLYRTITGQNAPAFDVLQAQAEAETTAPAKKGKQKAVPAAQQPSAVTSAGATAIAEAQARLDAEEAAKSIQGAVNEQPVRVQDDAGLRNVRVQGGTAGSNQKGLGLLQSQSVQPIQSGSVVGGQNRIEDDTTGTAGARPSTDELAAGRDATDGGNELAQAEAQVRELIGKVFGERDANIIYDVLRANLTGEQIGAKYGISQQRVDQIAGPKVQASWGARIKKYARRNGISEDQLRQMFELVERKQDVEVQEGTVIDHEAEAKATAVVDDRASQFKERSDQDEDTTLEKAPEFAEDTTPKDSDSSFDEDQNDGEDGEIDPYGSGFSIIDTSKGGGAKAEDTSSSNKSLKKLRAKGIESLKEHELNNVLIDEDATAEELIAVVERAKELERIRLGKNEPEGKKSAVQKPSAKKVPVRQRTEDSGKVAERNAEERQAAPEVKAEAKEKVAPATRAYTASEKAAVDLVNAVNAGGVPSDARRINNIARDLGLEVSTKARPEDTLNRIKEAVARIDLATIETKTAKEQWNDLAQQYEGMPAWNSLSETQQDRWADLASREQANLAAANNIAREMKGAGKEAKVKLTPEQKLFFKSLDYNEEIKSGDTSYKAAEITPDELFELFPGIRAVDDMFARLNLSQVVSGVQKILVFKGPVQNAAMVVHRQMPDGSIQTMLAFNESTLSSTDQDALGYTFTHETGHLVDYAGFGGVYSSHPDMDFVIKNGKYVSTGSVSRAFVNWVNNPNTSPELTELMMYPLQYTPDQMGMQEMKEELFAQGWALFLNPKYNRMMSEQAPAVYQFYSEVYKHVAQTTSFQYKSQSGAEVRAAVNAAGFTGSENRPAAQSANRLQRGPAGASKLQPTETRDTIRNSIESTRKFAEGEIAKLPEPYRGPLNAIMDTLASAARKGLTSIAFTKDLAAMAYQKGIRSAITYVNLMGERQAIKTENERRVDKIAQMFDQLAAKYKSTGPGSVNSFLKKSTMSGKWGFQPSWISDNVALDPATVAEFNALEPQAQKVVEAVFKHGYETLMEMKKSVMANINSEYDALIAEAQRNGDTKEEAELQKKKADTLKNYQTLMAVNANTPYAPLKRFGNYVVVGRSAKYLETEEIARSDTASPEERRQARKDLEKMQTNEDDYFVQFAETAAEAKAIARKTQSSYPGGLVQNFEKDQVRDSLYGGRDIQGVFYRLRNLVNESQEDKNISESSRKALNRLVNDLHLSLLSEHSARQSERRRKGVAGADDDMMRAFVTQGRATAHFLSTLHNTSDIYESLKAMKEEAEEKTEGRDVRSQYYNEMLKRHAMDLDYKVSPVIDKAMSATSTWMLLTSPAYYLQNMTQPFMLSLPTIAAKHGYTKSASEMIKAYKELTKVLTKNGLNEDTYSKLPADVQNAIESLVNSGHIDIGLSQDLGRWRSSGDQNAAARAMDKIRSISEDVEAVNRVVTAVAAYRLDKAAGASEQAAVKYAGKVVYDTHGDYSGFNAPRFSRQGIGRLATQFRKFQLIQISLIAKLGNQAFKGATAPERAIGRRALAFTLTHTFAVGGVMGLPGFTAIAAILGAIFGDSDEPDVSEATIRKMIGDDTLADLLTKGIPKLFGLDLSGKLGMGQTLSVLPYTEIDMSRDGYARAVTAAMGPFVGGIMPKVVDGVAQMSNGQYYKGIETMAPSGLSQAMKGYRFGTEGITKRNGEVILNPEEITFFDAFMQGIGLPTNMITDMQFVNRTEAQYEKFYSERTSDIKREYIEAYKKGDSEKLEEARQNWMNMQESRRANGFKVQPMSELFRAPMQAVKREAKTVKNLNTSGAAAAGFSLR